MAKEFDPTIPDAMAMPVKSIEPKNFDISRYVDWASAADQRFLEFMGKSE